jgi:superfamily I DNA/RNA helicase
MVAITFTNRAADEMRERLRRDVGRKAEKIFIGTFHSYCLEWLRRQTPELAVIGKEDRSTYLHRIFPDMDRSEQTLLGRQLSQYFDQLNRGVTSDFIDPDILEAYLAGLKQEKGIDLDYVIPFFVERLGQDKTFHAQVLDSVAALFVDEFQDLNAKQFELVTLLATPTTRVFAIGDPNQSIYGFRGSDLHFFTRFAQMENVTTLNLVRNYRSAPAIIDAATALIRHNRKSGMTQLIAKSELTTRLERYIAPSPQAEAEFIVKRIEESMGGISHFSINSGRGGNPDAEITGSPNNPTSWPRL